MIVQLTITETGERTMVKQESSGVETLETGNIYFIYRPRRNESEPSSEADIQRLFVVLKPKGKPRYRLLVMGRKELPDPDQAGRQRYWGFVDFVANRPKAIEDQFDLETRQTKTRGEQVQPPARPVGEGVYRLVRHKDHTHLVYALELPKEPGRPQGELNLEKEGSYIISVKNPEKPSPRGAGLGKDRQAAYPEELQQKFEGRRFFDLEPPEFLDYEGTQFVMIPAAEDVSRELNLELAPQQETGRSSDVFHDLHMEKEEHPVEPLFKGKWE